MLKNIKNPFLRVGIISILVLGSSVLMLVLLIYLGAWGKLPGKQELSDFKYQRASEVYSADSVLIGKYFLFDRQPIPFDAVPKNLIEALVAIEDERFYDHSGIDYKSLVRVALKTILMQDQSAGGGSTNALPEYRFLWRQYFRNRKCFPKIL